MKEFFANKFLNEEMKFVYHNPLFFSLPLDTQILLWKYTEAMKSIIEKKGRDEGVRAMKAVFRLRMIRYILIMKFLNRGIN